MAHSLWGYANGNITCPANDCKEWDKENSIAIGNIVLQVKESIQQDVIDLNSVAKVWLHLKDSYGTPTSTSIYKNFKEALSICINPNSHPGPQIDKMSTAFQHLSGAKCWKKTGTRAGNEWDCTGGEWANARGCPEGKYMHYIPGKCIVCQG